MTTAYQVDLVFQATGAERQLGGLERRLQQLEQRAAQINLGGGGNSFAGLSQGANQATAAVAALNAAILGSGGVAATSAAAATAGLGATAAAAATAGAATATGAKKGADAAKAQEQALKGVSAAMKQAIQDARAYALLEMQFQQSPNEFAARMRQAREQMLQRNAAGVAGLAPGGAYRAPNIPSAGAGASADKLRSVGRGAKEAAAGVNTLEAALAELGIAFSAVATIRFIFFKTAELETQTRSLKVLTGDLNKAKEIVQQLQQYGSVTPFTSTELVDAAKRLAAYGIEADKLVATTKRLGDVSGATGAELSGLVLAYGQVQAKGRLQGEELLQFTERGVGLQAELQKMYGLSGKEFQKALEQGRFSAKAVEVAIIRLTSAGGKYADGAISQSTTLNGKLSTLMDSVDALARTIGTALDPVFKWALDRATVTINEIKRLIDTAMNPGRAQVLDYIGRGEMPGYDFLGRNAQELENLLGGRKAYQDIFKEADKLAALRRQPVEEVRAQLIRDRLKRTRPELFPAETAGGKPETPPLDENRGANEQREAQDKARRVIELEEDTQRDILRLNKDTIKEIADFKIETAERANDLLRDLERDQLAANRRLEDAQLDLSTVQQRLSLTGSREEIEAAERIINADSDYRKSKLDRERKALDDSLARQQRFEEFKKDVAKTIGKMQEAYYKSYGDIQERYAINAAEILKVGAQNAGAIIEASATNAANTLGGGGAATSAAGGTAGGTAGGLSAGVDRIGGAYQFRGTTLAKNKKPGDYQSDPRENFFFDRRPQLIAGAKARIASLTPADWAALTYTVLTEAGPTDIGKLDVGANLLVRSANLGNAPISAVAKQPGQYAGVNGVGRIDLESVEAGRRRFGRQRYDAAMALLQGGGMPASTGPSTAATRGAIDGATIQRATAATARLTGATNECATTVKVFMESIGLNASVMDRSARSAENMGTVMTDWSQLRPGDIVARGRVGDPEHVGVYTGGPNVFHQSRGRGLKAGNYPDLGYFQQNGYFIRPNAAMTGGAAPGRVTPDLKPLPPRLNPDQFAGPDLRGVEQDFTAASRGLDATGRKAGETEGQAQAASILLEETRIIQGINEERRTGLRIGEEDMKQEQARLGYLRDGVLPAMAEKLALLDREADDDKRLLKIQETRYKAALDSGQLSKDLVPVYQELLKLTQGELAAVDGITAARRDQLVQMEALRKDPGNIITKGVGDARERLDELTNAGNNAVFVAKEAGQAFGALFKDIVDGSKTAEEALVAFLNRLADTFLNRVADIIAAQAELSLLKLFRVGGGPAAAAVGGAAAGGAGGGLESVLTNQDFLNYAGPVPTFAGGGYTGSGSRSGGVDGRGGFPALLHPNETVIDHSAGQAVGGGAITSNVVVNISGGQTTTTTDQPTNLSREIEGAVVAVLAKHRRPGGMLAN